MQKFSAYDGSKSEISTILVFNSFSTQCFCSSV